MSKSKHSLDKRFIAIAVIFIVALYVILPQLGDFKASRHLLSHPEMPWLVLAACCMLLTYAAAAGTYYFLAFKKLKYWRTVLVQLAAMFVNRLLPGGVGALGANFLYLKRNHNNSGQAGTIVTINNLLGFLGHGILTLLIFLVYSGSAVHLDSGDTTEGNSLVKYVLGAILIVLSIVVFIARKRINKLLKEVFKQLANYGRQPWKILLALTTSILLTSANVLCLYFCMQAIGVGLSLFAVFLIFSFGVGAGTATPTPGGLGGYEAALMTGFIAYGVDSPTALAIALLYRFVSYWTALLLGCAAFVYSQKRAYI